jgi:hypothetical protein
MQPDETPDSTANSPGGTQEQTALTLATLLQIEREARHARSQATFRFVVVNETHRLVGYDQMVLWRIDDRDKVRIEAVSGVADISRETPYIHWLEQVISGHARGSDGRRVHEVEPERISAAAGREWREWINGTVLWCPLLTPGDVLLGGLWLIRSSGAWHTSEQALLKRLADAYAHAWQSLMHKSGVRSRRWSWKPGRGRARLMALLLVGLVLIIPVRQSALAPAEVIPLDPVIVTSPLDGVIREIHVEPNAPVREGDLLFSLDDTTLRNRHQVAVKAAEVAQAEYLRAAQKAFKDEASKAELAMLRARVGLRQAEARFTSELLEKVHVHADRDGIAIFTAANDWLGQPVIIGEKIMTLADPELVQMQLWLPVDDAINLEKGARVALFLNIRPTRPLTGKLYQTSYEAQVTAEGNLAYQLKARFDTGEELPRIGLKGTGKIHGRRVLLVHYLLRRPLSAVRRFTGL